MCSLEYIACPGPVALPGAIPCAAGGTTARLTDCQGVRGSVTCAICADCRRRQAVYFDVRQAAVAAGGFALPCGCVYSRDGRQRLGPPCWQHGEGLASPDNRDEVLRQDRNDTETSWRREVRA